jgi:hypothetical protein
LLPIVFEYEGGRTFDIYMLYNAYNNGGDGQIYKIEKIQTQPLGHIPPLYIDKMHLSINLIQRDSRENVSTLKQAHSGVPQIVSPLKS